MFTRDFNPWKNIDEFDPAQFADKSSELLQWPIKLWKAPIVSPYYHHAHLMIAADCSAFSYANFHNAYTKGKVTLICCMDTDFDVMTKLSQILSNNSVKSVTVVKTDKNCCTDLSVAVMQAVKSSRLPVPVQVSTIFIDAEDLTEEDAF
ncbi:MAG: hypothetical protein EOM00_05090 [Clostridia bacterium]|nr:hypothetical protein [Clostridia bacterium]